MSIFLEILVRRASYGPQIDQSHGENRLSHIIIQAVVSVIYLFLFRFGFLPFLSKAQTRGGCGEKSMKYNKHLISLVFSVRTVNYGPSFFPFSTPVLTGLGMRP